MHHVVRLLALSLFCYAPILPAAELHPVVTKAIERQQTYQATRIFAGRVLGSQRANIGFEQAGMVEKVAVDDGQSVKMGQVLAQLDQRALAIEKGELDAQQREVAARLAQLRRDAERYEALKAKAYVSDGQLDDVKTRLTATQAQLAQIRSRLDGVQLRLQKSVLRAPFDGEIASLQVEEGVVVAPGQVAMQLVELARSEAVFGISDKLGRNLVTGQTMEVFGDFGRIEASLLSVANNLDWRTQTRMIRVELPVDAPVVDGNTAYIHIPERRNVQGFWLPEQALLEDVRGTWAIYVLAQSGENYVLNKHSVQALYHYGGQVYVQSELPAGRLVVTEGVHRLAPGQQVRLAAGGQANVAISE